MKNIILFNFFLLFVVVVLAMISSCDCEFSTSPTINLTLEYSVDGFDDTLQVNDTVIIKHEMPFSLADDTGFVYNLTGLNYFPLLDIGMLEDNNRTALPGEDFFKVISIGKGEVLNNYIGNNVLLREIIFLELEDRLTFEVKLVPKKKGEFVLRFFYVDTDLSNIQLQDLGNCGNESVIFDFDFISDTSTVSRFENDSIWIGQQSQEINLFELDRRFDFYNFVVVE